MKKKNNVGLRILSLAILIFLTICIIYCSVQYKQNYIILCIICQSLNPKGNQDQNYKIEKFLSKCTQAHFLWYN